MRTFAAATVLVVAAAVSFGLAHAVAPPPPGSSELAVEQRLMCPQCTATRLDVCDRQICADMKADIRRRLAAGEAPDTIVSSYAHRYGPDVLAEPRPSIDAATWVPWLISAGALILLLAAAVGARPRRGARPPA
jgi:cytochrome c-type biogenesis protein CcmH/NrfF